MYTVNKQPGVYVLAQWAVEHGVEWVKTRQLNRNRFLAVDCRNSDDVRIIGKGSTLHEALFMAYDNWEEKS